MIVAHEQNNILIFSPTPSHPQSAGNRIRIYNLARYIQLQGYRVHFVFYAQEWVDDAAIAAMEEAWDSFTLIEKDKEYIRGKPNYYLIDDWYQENIGPIVASICSEFNIDIILINYIFQSKLLDFVPNTILKLIDTHDRFSDRHIMLQANDIKPDFFYTVKDEEAKAFARADIILAIQDKEAGFFRTLTDQRVEVIGHIEEKRFLDKEYSTLRIIGFIGSSNSVNFNSISRFIDKFTEYIEKQQLSIDLWIAGSVCTKIESTHPSIKLLGFMEDLDDFYGAVDLIVNPLILGTGLKIKSVEALSYGVPIVSTDIGFEGIQTVSPYHLAENLDALIANIDQLNAHSEILQDLALLSRTIHEQSNQELDDVFSRTFKAKAQMPSLLFITHINFWERDLGSRMRLYHLLNYVKANFSVHIVYTEKRRSTDEKKLREIGYLQQVVFLDELTESEVDEVKINLFLEQHAVLQDFYDATRYRKLQTYLKLHSFDNIIIEYIQFSYFLPLLDSAVCFLDSHDMMNIRNEVFKKNNEQHWIDISEAQELALFKAYNSVICIQKKEHNYLIDKGIRSILVPYSFHAVKEFQNRGCKNIVFIGGNNQANAEAINWFIAHVWPLFARSGLRLEVFGTVSRSVKSDKKSLNRMNVFVNGKIDDLNYLYREKADMVINPVHLGGGLKIKNVEALANALPLITTTEGANGLEDGINKAFLRADSVDEWTNAIIALMISDTLRKKLSKNAVRFAEEHFSDKTCYQEFVEILEKNKCVNCEVK